MPHNVVALCAPSPFSPNNTIDSIYALDSPLLMACA